MNYFLEGRKKQKLGQWHAANLFYEEGIKNGCPFCEFGKAYILYTGPAGIIKNKKLAQAIFKRMFPIYEKLSKEGNCYASQILAYYYGYGFCVYQNKFKYKEYYDLALEQGNPELKLERGNELIKAKKYEEGVQLLLDCYEAGFEDCLNIIPIHVMLGGKLSYETLERIYLIVDNQYKKEQEKELKRREIARKQKEEEEKRIEEITSMEIPLDWNNAFDDSDVVKGVYAQTPADALILSLNELGYVDVEYISKITNMSLKDVILDLKGSIYQDPERWEECFYKGWVLSDEYLSGNLLKKLKIAEKANAKYKGFFEDNVNAIKRILPKAISSSDIYITLSSPWVPQNIVKEFIYQITNLEENAKNRVVYSEVTGSWDIKITRSNSHDYLYRLDLDYGTKAMTGLTMLKRTLNMKSVVVMHKDKQGKYNIDNAETIIATDKQKKLNDAFKSFIYTNPKRLKEVTDAYNDVYGYNVARVYNGSFLKLPGLNKDVELFDYQKNAVARIIFNKNTLLAHDVGAGKTFIMIASGEELIRLKLSKKNLYVIPNNIVSQWETMYKTLYPNAKIKIVEPKNFTPSKRNEEIEDMKSGDYHAVIIAYSCFEHIDVSNKFKIKILEEKLNQAKSIDPEFQSKEYIKSLEKKLEKLNDEIETDTELKFDHLGFTRLYLDEAHNYKNVPIVSKINRVLGINMKGSNKCEEMADKVKYINGLHNGGVIMATGTPITNSITDCYVFQQYLQPGQLKLYNINSFDDWVSMFVERNEEFEIDVDSAGYRMATRFSRFHNLPELTSILANIADFHIIGKDPELPTFNGYKDIVLNQSPELNKYIDKLSKRADDCRSGKVSRKVDNMLKITTDGRLAALDIRLVDNKVSRRKVNTKVFNCAENVFNIWQTTKVAKSTQLVFCDTSTPKPEFNLYDELKNILTKFGIPSDEIEFVHNATTETKRKELFKKVVNGQIRVLIGSTFKLGMGVNVQEKLIAIHHLDVPWRPADMVQREGRIIRKGNTNKEVFIYRYIQEGSFDSYSWQLLETKQHFINELLSNSVTVRSVDDIENTVLNYGEVKALAIGNPKLKERFETYNELSRLKMLNQKYIQMRFIHEQQLEESKKKITELEAKKALFIEDSKRYQENKLEYNQEERNKLRDLIFESLVQNDLKEEESHLIDYQGFEIILPSNMVLDKSYLYLKGNHKHLVEMSLSRVGCLIRIDNYLENISEKAEEIAKQIEFNKSKIENLTKELAVELDYESQIKKLQTKLDKLDKELK